MGERGELKVYKRIPALSLWRKMLTMLFETGHPWITFKDPCNIRSPQQHMGVVHSSNLCTEITLNTNEDEIAVCNLGSVNLAAHMGADGKLDAEKLQRTIRIALRMLDNVIDINYYPVKKARNSNLKHRPVGMGIMGFQDCLHMKRVPYASQEAVEFADESMEAGGYYAYWAAPNWPKSAAATRRTRAACGIVACCRKTASTCWQPNAAAIWKWTAPNAWTGTPCANASSSTACATPTPGHRPDRHHRQHHWRVCQHRADLPEPVRQIQPVRRIHRHQRIPGARPEKAGLWDEVMVADLKYFDGSLGRIDRIRPT
jgi:ribonucleoside-diphosphate reductase alpha chain